MFVLFLSPPEIPRVICVPTWGKHTQTKPCSQLVLTPPDILKTEADNKVLVDK